MEPIPCYSQSQVVYTYQVLFIYVAPRVFLDKIPYLAFFSRYHGNYSPDFFSPCFKLDQNLLSCQVSEKSTNRFSQNDGGGGFGT